MEKNQKKLQKLLSENPDPSKWSMWLKIIIAVLSALLGAIGEHYTDAVSSVLNVFSF